MLAKSWKRHLEAEDTFKDENEVNDAINERGEKEIVDKQSKAGEW